MSLTVSSPWKFFQLLYTSPTHSLSHTRYIIYLQSIVSVKMNVKARASKLYLRNSNAILMSLKTYDHREGGEMSCALSVQDAGSG